MYGLLYDSLLTSSPAEGNLYAAALISLRPAPPVFLHRDGTVRVQLPIYIATALCIGQGACAFIVNSSRNWNGGWDPLLAVCLVRNASAPQGAA